MQINQNNNKKAKIKENKNAIEILKLHNSIQNKVNVI